jgi:hypothetical protein
MIYNAAQYLKGGVAPFNFSDGHQKLHTSTVEAITGA